jgi:predicted type IV restriction endonuclease
LSTFHEQLVRLAEQIRRRQPHIRGEESTKQALILPFFSALGYDVHDPTEVEPEYVADFAKRRSSGPSEKVDYAIRRNGAPVIFVECKAVDCDPNNHSGQLARYFNATPSVPIAILTNGLRYVFFTDLQDKNILSESPFFEFNILSFSNNDCEVLESFSRARFDPLTVRERAEEIIYSSKIISFMGDLLRTPSDSFTRFVLSELNMFSGQRLTSRLVEKFTPTIRHAIQTALLDMATRSIREHGGERVESPPVVSPPPPALPPPPPVTSAAAGMAATSRPDAANTSAAPTGKAGQAVVVTTPDELEAFEIVRSICADSTLKAPVVSRDTTQWFTISAGSPRKWFTKLYFNQKRKSIVTKITPARAVPLAPGFEVEAFQDGSRVYINTTKDLLRLRPLLLIAFEEEVKRNDSGIDDGDAPGPAST